MPLGRRAKRAAERNVCACGMKIFGQRTYSIVALADFKKETLI